jgi:hypothetical protein
MTAAAGASLGKRPGVRLAEASWPKAAALAMADIDKTRIDLKLKGFLLIGDSFGN